MPDYSRNPPLNEGDLAADPLVQLERWLAEAAAAGMIEPGAMTLATVADDGRPSARIVLFKGIVDGGLSFYTNYEGRKGRELARDPRAALVFWWDRLERQVRVEGRVEKLAPAQSRAYFQQRPRASQLGALASRQSQPVASRAELDARLESLTREHEGRDVPCPPHWGGYRLVPERFEFWLGRRNRMHDRLELQRAADGAWRLRRLEP
jgi:pyridoxamine 5'-phosphate oxidase